MDSGEKIWAEFGAWLSPLGGGAFPSGHYHRCILSFERGYFWITIPGKRVFYTNPRDVSRTAPLVLRVNLGGWKIGWFTLRFDSPKAADKIELELKKMMHAAKEPII